MEKPLSYNKISLEKRKQLVDLVIVDKYSIAKASKALQIKNSTAKLIVKRYRDTGTFFQPKRQRQAEGPNPVIDIESSPTSRQHNAQQQNNQMVAVGASQAPILYYFGHNGEMVNLWSFEWQNYLSIMAGLQYSQ